MKFKVGDYVEPLIKIKGAKPGMYGKVCKVLNDYGDIYYGVEFNERVGGHDCHCSCKYGYGLFFRPHNIRSVYSDVEDSIAYESNETFLDALLSP